MPMVLTSALRRTSLRSLQSLLAVNCKPLRVQLVIKTEKKTHTQTMVEGNYQDDCS